MKDGRKMSGNTVSVDRIIIAAPKSGSGKTMFTIGLIRVLMRRGLRVGSRKCGPDYIDPMFHRRALLINSGNLDPYFTKDDMLRYLLSSGCRDNDITVIEGVMGYYDGLGGISSEAGTYDVARKTDSPVILVVDAKGASVTLAAIIKGVLDFKKDNRIRGIILNRLSPSFYERIKNVIEAECGVSVLGYIPELKDIEISSRHLGLIQPCEIDDIDVKINRIADCIEETVSIDMILDTAREAPALSSEVPAEHAALLLSDKAEGVRRAKPVIAVASDEAFGFWYDDNIRLLKEFGAEIAYFSPLHDKRLPDNAAGVILYGGYPENHAKALHDNAAMRSSVREAYDRGIPIIAECGGFMYLQDKLEDKDGSEYDMCGVIPGKAYHTGHLVRFGYLEAEALKSGLYGQAGLKFRGHEFHHWDCTVNGEDFQAEKPMSDKRFGCMIHEDRLAAGFPHIYAYNDPMMYLNFLEKCAGAKI